MREGEHARKQRLENKQQSGNKIDNNLALKCVEGRSSHLNSQECAQPGETHGEASNICRQGGEEPGGLERDDNNTDRSRSRSPQGGCCAAHTRQPHAGSNKFWFGRKREIGLRDTAPPLMCGEQGVPLQNSGHEAVGSGRGVKQAPRAPAEF